MNDDDVAALWRAGSLRGQVRALIGFACVLTIAIAVIGARLMWSYTFAHGLHDPFWYRNLPGAIVIGVLAIALVTPGRSSRWIRVALVLPVAQVAAMIVAWRLAASLDPDADLVPFTRMLPMPVALAGLAAIYVAAAAAIARRRERLHAIVMIALANLALVGLWLPIASRLWCGEYVAFPDQYVRIDGGMPRLALLAFAPPLAIAIAFTALRFRRRRALAFTRPLGVLFAGAFVASLGRYRIQDYALDNLLHVLLAIGVLAVAAIGVLALAIAIDARRARGRLMAPDRLAGVIRCDEPVAGAVAFASWLRGPSQILAPFAIATPRGDIPIPGGARWVGPLPTSTTLLRRGEAAVVLRAGDPVVASGFVEPASTDPFRSSRAWIPGAREILLGRVEDTHAATDIGLALWRPSVAYLAIVIAIGVPALVSALCVM